MAKDRFGLRELPKDSNDISFGAITVLPKDLPESFSLPYLTVKNQGDTDYCSQYASCLASEYQEGVELIPEVTFAYSKKDNPNDWGADLRSACKAQQKFGAVDVDSFDINTIPKDKQRFFTEYPPELAQNALTHAKKTYVRLYSFDDIVGALYKEKRAVLLGVIWSWRLGTYTIETYTDAGFGHAVCAIGWRTVDGVRFLEIQNSYGIGAGKDGKHLIREDIINHFVERFGAFCFIDMDVEQAKEIHKRSVWTRASMCGKIKLQAKRYWNEIWK